MKTRIIELRIIVETRMGEFALLRKRIAELCIIVFCEERIVERCIMMKQAHGGMRIIMQQMHN